MKVFASAPAFLLILGGGLVCAPGIAGEKKVPELSGIWKIDEELSEDPLVKVREAQQTRGKAAGGGGASVVQGGSGGSGGPTHAGPTSGVPQVPQAGAPQGGTPQGGTSSGGSAGGSATIQGGPEPPAKLEERLAALQESRWQVEITQADSEVSLRYGTGEAITLSTDGKAKWVESDHGDFDMSARWKKNGRLVIKSKAREGSSIETYMVGGEGRLLTVITEMDMGRLGWITYRWLYRPRTVVEKAGLVRRN